MYIEEIREFTSRINAHWEGQACLLKFKSNQAANIVLEVEKVLEKRGLNLYQIPGVEVINNKIEIVNISSYKIIQQILLEQST